MTLDIQLKVLEASGLVRLAQLAPELEYLFRHALVQEAAYDSLLRQDRRVLHHAVAEVLETSFPDRLDEFAARLADHFAEAGDRERALPYFTRAADHAFDQYATAEAVALYGRALEMTSPDTPTETLTHLYLRRGRAAELRGDYDQALAIYDDMETAAAHGREALLLDSLLARATIRATFNLAHDFDAAVALVEQALDLARQVGNRAAEARGLWLKALAYGFSRGDAQTAMPIIQQSLALTRELGDQEQLALVLTDISNIRLMTSQIQDAAAPLEEARVIWRALGNLPMLAFNLNLSSQLSLLQGRIEHVIGFAEEAVHITLAIHNDEGFGFSQGVLGQGYFLKGEVGKAILLTGEVLDDPETAHLPGTLYGRAIWAYNFSLLGACDRVAPLTAEVLATPGLGSFPEVMRSEVILHMARAELRCGGPGPANALLKAEAQRGDPDSSRFYLMGTLAIELEFYARRYEETLHRADQVLAELRRAAIGLFIPDVLLLKGQALAALGRVDEAVDVLRYAQAQAATNSNRMILWRILAALADGVEQQGDDDEAALLRREAAGSVDHIASTLSDFPELGDSFIAQRDVTALRGKIGKE